MLGFRAIVAGQVARRIAPALRWQGAAAARALSTTTPAAATPAPLAPGGADEFSSQDHYFEKDRIHKGKGDPNKRTFVYFMLGAGRFIYASTARLTFLKFISSMSATADVLALASAEIDLSTIDTGSTMTVKWRGKPVFIRRRTEDEILAESAVPLELLRDPEPDEDRVIKPEYLVIVGVCTHLGCVPISGAGEYNGWFCPCHGSHYDTSGRIRKGPAPLNMEVPPYKFIEDLKIQVG